MSPFIEAATDISDLHTDRFVSDGKKIVFASSWIRDNQEDAGLNHQQLAQKYNLHTGFDSEERPIVKAAGRIRIVGQEPDLKIKFLNDTTSCLIKGNWQEQQEALNEVHKLAKQVLGEDKVADCP